MYDHREKEEPTTHEIVREEVKLLSTTEHYKRLLQKIIKDDSIPEKAL